MTKLALAAGAAIALATSATIGPRVPAAFAQEADRQLGNVHFATSCNEVAQRRFDRAMRYQHSFWYRQSRELFESVLEADSFSLAVRRIIIGNDYDFAAPKIHSERMMPRPFAGAARARRRGYRKTVRDTRRPGYSSRPHFLHGRAW